MSIRGLIYSIALNLMFCSTLQVCYGQEPSIDNSLEKLTNQIASGLTTGNKRKIAVIEFSTLDGKITELGQYISEELITRLFQTAKFEVVERQLLNKILDEHRLNMTGLIDPSQAKTLGQILGVDAICTGTITDLGKSIKLNARLITTDTGKIFSVASSEILKNDTVTRLLGKIYSKAGKNTNSSSNMKEQIQGKYILYEDFANVQEGTAPAGWIGTENVMVKQSGNKKHLTQYQEGPAKLVIPVTMIPENFRLEWDWQSIRPRHDGRYARVNIGNIFVTIGNWNFSNTLAALSVGHELSGSYTLHNGPDLIKQGKMSGKFFELQLWRQPVLVRLEKQADIVKLFIDDVQVAITRISNFEQTDRLTFNFNDLSFILNKVALFELK